MSTPRHLLVLQQLLPPIAYDPNGPELVVELTAVGNALDAAEDSADQVLRAMDPAALPEMLPEWEEAYGLPERCDLALTPSIAARQAAVMGKKARRASFSASYLISLAATLGYPGVTLRKHRPATCASRCDTPLYGPMHRCLLDVIVPLSRPARFATCADPCTVQLRQYDDSRLECAFRHIQPAHMLFRFFYEG